jgi:dTDP-4-amino-4,6-dideoxygalactose transaminase
MNVVTDVARRHGLVVIEDAAQGLLSSYRGRPLGSLGDLAAFSFHETKNVMCGEGGALAINNARYADRAEILWEKGTNRTSFSRGEVDRYTWMDLGSSFLAGELSAAFLWAQLESADEITAARRSIWEAYYHACAGLVDSGVELPTVPPDCAHNAHLFRLLLPRHVNRRELLAELNHRGVNAVFHYVPLHSSPAGRRYGRVATSMSITDDCSSRLIRLPLWIGIGDETTRRISAELSAAIVTRV